MIDAFVSLVGADRWAARLRDIEDQAVAGRHTGRVLRQRHAIEYAIERLRRAARPPSAAERRIAALAGEAVALSKRLSKSGRVRLQSSLATGLEGDATLLPVFHLLRSAVTQRARGFDVVFPGLEEAAPFDLLLRRAGVEAEVVCDVVSAEEGRSLHRGAWFQLADRIDPDLQTWLTSHPGRYLLKLTLPCGLRSELQSGSDALARLHDRVRRLLSGSSRSDRDAAVVLRLDPLLLAGAQSDELGIVSSLRREFGPEAHLAVVASGGGVFVLAARAGQEDAIAAAVRLRMATIAPNRLSGTRPGILTMLIDDIDPSEWLGLRERLELEGEARHFLTGPEARSVVAVTCMSRLELFGTTSPDAEANGELRFRNPAHPAAKVSALAPAVISRP